MGSGVAVGAGVGTSVGVGSGVAVGAGVGTSVGVGSGVAVGAGVGTSVGVGSGVAVGVGVGVAVGAAVGTGVGVTAVGAGLSEHPVTSVTKSAAPTNSRHTVRLDMPDPFRKGNRPPNASFPKLKFI